MTKTGSTKNKILNLLLSGNKTLSDISNELHLAPSTVSQHLQELNAMGAVKEVQNDHIKKWKYYELNPDFNYSESPIGGGIIPSRIPRRSIVYYAIGLIIIAGAALFLLSGSVNSTQAILQGQNGTYVPIRLTDPPHVPVGTNSLSISYSQVSVHVSGSAKSGWIVSNSMGSIDLMSLLNVSQVIAAANVPPNSIINMARFNITSAYIVINGTKYNVTVPSGQVTAHVAGNEKINSSEGVLLDLSPTVAAIYTQNSTVFVLVPAVKAVLVPGENSIISSKINEGIGIREKLRQVDIDDLKNVPTNISITNASVSSTNDILGIRVTLTNLGNANVTLTNLLILGNQTPVILYNSTCGTFSGNNAEIPLWCRLTGKYEAQVHSHQVASIPRAFSGDSGYSGGIYTNISGSMHDMMNNISEKMGIHINITSNSSENFNDTMDLNSSLMMDEHAGWIRNKFNFSNSKIEINVEDAGDENAVLQSENNITLSNPALLHLFLPSSNGEKNGNANENVSITVNHILPVIEPQRGLYFLIEANGTLTLASQVHPMFMEMHTINDIGYTLKPGQSVTLSFNGQVSFPGDFRVSLVPGAHYRIEVYGQGGAHSIANVTAT